MNITHFLQGFQIREEVVKKKRLESVTFFLTVENTISSRIRNRKKISFLLVSFRNCYKCFKVAVMLTRITIPLRE